MTTENFDWKAAEAVELYLKLKRENHKMELTIEKNKEQMAALLKEFPQIGNVKGMLRKTKAEKAPENPTPNSSPSKLTTTTTSAMEVDSSKTKKRKKSAEKSDLRSLLIQKESKRQRKTDAEKGRVSGVEAGGSIFHSTSHSSPPPPSS